MKQKVVFFATLAALVSISFAFYAIVNFKAYNSDFAIQLLMSEDFQLPRDLYFRGQDRLGSLIPLLAYPLVLLKVNTFWAASIVQYLLLLGTFGFLSTLFSKWWQKLSLAIIVFFPNWAFVDQVHIAQPYISHHFILALFLWLYFKAKLQENFKTILLIVFAGLMMWTSEMAAINLGLFSVLFYKELLQRLRLKHAKIYVAIAAISVLCFLLLAKLYAENAGVYYQFFASWPEFKKAIAYNTGLLWQVATFGGNKPISPWLFYVLLFFVPFIFIFGRPINILTKYFIYSALGTAILVLLSHWSALNNYPNRYFTSAYFFLLLALLMHAETLPWRKTKQITTLVLTVLSACSGVYFVTQFTLEIDTLMTKTEMQAVVKKGRFGVIGSYWNSHALDALSPNVVATPYDGFYLRMPEKVQDVMTQDSILIIKNGFLESLPDTLDQYGQTLVKSGKNQTLHEFEFAFYKKLVRN